MVIRKVEDIAGLLVGGCEDWTRYGHVNAKHNGDLTIFSFTLQARVEGQWNFFERASRGLILNSKTGEIVARPFDKFFSWGEGGRNTSSQLVRVTKKLDGSLGILYRQAGYKVATIGSLTGSHAAWATDFLRENYSLGDLPNEYTLLLEMIFPDNRVVVDYGNREDLVLLAIRNRFDGSYLGQQAVQRIALRCGFATPHEFTFASTDELLASTAALAQGEGFVAELKDGSRFKFRSPKYRKVHALTRMVTFKDVVVAVSNETIDQTFARVPRKSAVQLSEWAAEIEATKEKILNRVHDAYTNAPVDDRTLLENWIARQDTELVPVLWAIVEGRDVTKSIYESCFSHRLDSTTIMLDRRDREIVIRAANDEGVAIGDLVRKGLHDELDRLCGG